MPVRTAGGTSSLPKRSRAITPREDFRIRNGVNPVARRAKDGTPEVDSGAEGEAVVVDLVEAVGTTGGKHKGKTR